MKKYIFILAAIVIVAGIVFAKTNNRSSRTIKTDGVLSVNDIQADPYAYKGTITITGVVADKTKYRIDPKVFLMVETGEAKSCKITGCAKFYLPVSYEGGHPREWDEVNVTGSFTEGGTLFMATKVDVLRHLTF